MIYEMKAVTRLTLDMRIPDVQRSFSITHGDENRRIEVTLIDGGRPFVLPPKWTAILAGVRPSGNEIYNGCINADGRIIYDFSKEDALSSEMGFFEIGFDIFNELGDVVASPRVGVNVVRSARSFLQIGSDPQFTALKQFVEQIGAVESELENHGTALEQLQSMTSAFGSTVIRKGDWTDETPYTALLPVSGLGKDTMTIFFPLDDDTREAAGEARLAMMISSTIDGNPTDYVVFARSDESKAPDLDMSLGYIVLRGKGDSKDPYVALIGVDAVGSGSGSGSGENSGDSETIVVEQAAKAITIPANTWAKTKSLGLSTWITGAIPLDDVKPATLVRLSALDALTATDMTTGQVGAEITYNEETDLYSLRVGIIGGKPSGDWQLLMETTTVESDEEVSGPWVSVVPPTEDATNKVAAHNYDEAAHPDLREKVNNLNADTIGADPKGTAEKKVAEAVEQISQSVTTRLAEYYKKNETYNKTEIDGKLSAIPKFAIKPVDSLPTTGISYTTVYLLKNKTDSGDLYTEYIRVTVDGADVWEELGRQRVDLSGYVTEQMVEEALKSKVTEEQVNALLNSKLTAYLTTAKAAELYQPKGDYVVSVAGKGLSTNDYSNTEKAKLNQAATDAAEAKNQASAALTRATAAETNAAASAASAAEVQRRIESGELDGEDGAPGYNPIRGTDYWTPEDIAAMESDNKAYIIEELAKRNQVKIPVVQSVEEMTDPNLLYLMVKDGSLWYYAYSTTVVPGGQPLFTNALDGTNKRINTRWSRSSKAYTAADGYMATDKIPVKVEQTVYVNLPRLGFLGNYPRIFFLDANGNYCDSKDTAAASCHVIKTDENDVSSFVVGYEMSVNNDTATNGKVSGYDNITHMIIVFNMWAVVSGNTATAGAITENDVADLIVSVGDPIAYSEASEGNDWTPIQPLIYTDHTEDINALKATVGQHALKLAALEQGAAGAEDIRTWDKPVYDAAPVTLLGDDRVKPAVDGRDTVQAVINAYDGLVSRHPRYVTKTPYKDTTADGQTLYRYDIQAPKPHEYGGGIGNFSGTTNPDIVRPKAILISGIHKEMVGVWSLYHAIEEILENNDFVDLLRNVHLIVVPLANPYCISGAYAVTNGRKNARGVEIHRNFSVDHVVIDSTSNNYGGAEPLSEIETQHIDSIMRDNPDAAFFISAHNFDAGGGGDYKTTFMWASTATNYLYTLGGRFGVKLSEAWEDKYGDTWRSNIDANKTANQPNGDYTVCMAGKSSTPGTEAKQALLYGIQGMTFEVGGNMVALGASGGDSVTVTRGAEVYANLIRTLFAAYDPKDKKAYTFKN